MTENTELEVTTPYAFAVRAVSTNPVTITPDGHSVILVPVPGAVGPRGFPGGGSQITRQALIGTQDGVNTDFSTVYGFQSGTTMLFRNGLLEDHYTEVLPATIEFEDAPLPSDDILISYVLA